jgi:hypothetical protein
MIEGFEGVDLPLHMLNELLPVLRALGGFETVRLNRNVVILFEIITLVNLPETPTSQ